MPDKRLYETPLFQWAIAAPLIATSFVTYEICTANEIAYSFKKEELENLLDLFKLPLGILGLSIPFVAVSAAIHRSAQTAHQIQVQHEQNNFANHFKHLEEFKKAIGHPPKPFQSVEEFHMFIYPGKNGEITKPNICPGSHAAVIEALRRLLKRANCQPLKLQETTKEIFQRLCLSLEIERGAPKVASIEPSDIIALADKLDQALSFSGKNLPIYRVDDKVRQAVCRLDSLNNTYNQFLANKEAIVDKILSPPNDDDEESVPLLTQLSLYQNGDQRHLELAATLIDIDYKSTEPSKRTNPDFYGLSGVYFSGNEKKTAM